MIDLNFTNEEIEALKEYINEKYEAMNQMLISNSETDIALLSNDVENEVISISYERESVIENLKNIKLVYQLILKNYYKNTPRKNICYRGTNLAEVERLKNEPFIDKMLTATTKKNEAEDIYSARWNRPASINLILDSNVPYIYIDEILQTNTNQVLIAPFTKIKAISLETEKNLENNSKLLKIYDIEIEKQDLDELTDKERFGLYNYILDNSYLIKRKLEECIRFEKENTVNFENIRKLEQLLVKYENEIEEKEIENSYSDIEREDDLSNIERINKELEELKKVSTNVFEIRKSNINFINMWKRNIAVYMIAECREIEKNFEGLSFPDEKNVEKANTMSETMDVLNKTSNNENSDNVSVIAEEMENLMKACEASEKEILSKYEIPEDVRRIAEEIKKEVKAEVETAKIEDEFVLRVRNESKENLDVGEKLLKDIKDLITKQQNHAKVAGNMGASYSALNNAFEMRNVAEILFELLKKIDSKVKGLTSEEISDVIKNKLEEISKVNIEISTLMNYLNNPKIAVRNSKATRFDEMAIIEENELKKGIAEKIRDIRGEAELKKLKDDLEMIEEKSSFRRLLGFFTGQNRLDDVMIEQIEVRQMAIRRTLAQKMSLAYNYSIHELMAEITMFVNDNEDDELVEDDVLDLKALAEELRRNYIVLESKVQSIVEEREGKNLPVDTKKVSRSELLEIETYRFLNKYGYDKQTEHKEEPKYQDTMASEIARIIEYINSSKIF